MLLILFKRFQKSKNIRIWIEQEFQQIFLDLCNKNKGKLISVDVDNYKNLFKSKNWTFIHSRDDNYKYIEKFYQKIRYYSFR